MKRITYISSFARPMDSDEIDELGRASSRNNRTRGVTGMLLCVHGLFFQIIEGGEQDVAELFQTIKEDPRHQDVLCLKTELDVTERLFPKWSMHTVNLEKSGDKVLQAVRVLLQNIGESHRIIEKYTQTSVIKILMQGINPLTVPVQRTDKIIFFGDIVGFSSLSEAFPVEEVADVVCRFLEVCSSTIVSHGGEVAKYIGDCVMAHFDPSQADDALQASLDILHELERLRRQAGECRLLKFLYCGIGLSQGHVIQGNIGSSIKMDYTILGDAVNTSSRLESLTRTLGKSLVFTHLIKNGTQKPWRFVSCGQYQLKGKETECDVYTLNEPIVSEIKTSQEINQQIRTVCV